MRRWCKDSRRHSVVQRGGGGGGMWNRQFHIQVWWIKIRRDALGVSHPSPRPDCREQGSSARKINPKNFCL